jgi:hypothetical protein
MSKIININPALFSFSGGSGTRKKQPKTDMKMKIKSSLTKENNKTTKRALLKYIRNQQEKNYEKSMKTEKAIAPVMLQSESDKFRTDFDESLKYLKEITEQNDKNIKPVNQMNRTLRHIQPIINQTFPTIGSSAIGSSAIGSSAIGSSAINVSAINASTINASTVDILDHINYPKMNYPMPQHGCLKKGLLPTYRTWRNTTQRNNINSSIHGSMHGSMHGPMHGSMHGSMHVPIHDGNSQQRPHPPQQQTQIQSILPVSLRELELNQNLKKMSEINQLSAKLNVHKAKGLYYPKQKRILRRTYTVGKSKVFPKISVLVSNKTIRNNISTKTQLLKQVPMNDVKKYLIKHGFIRVGTVAPNDVLRKMYESAILICGNINNHNPDNLLYNYLNDKDKD